MSTIELIDTNSLAFILNFSLVASGSYSVFFSEKAYIKGGEGELREDG